MTDVVYFGKGQHITGYYGHKKYSVVLIDESEFFAIGTYRDGINSLIFWEPLVYDANGFYPIDGNDDCIELFSTYMLTYAKFLNQAHEWINQNKELVGRLDGN